MVGYYHNFQQQGQIRRYTLTSTNSGEGFGPEYDGGVYGTQFSDIQYLPGSSTEYRIIGSENYGSGNPDNGTYCYDNFVVGNKFKISNGTENIAGLSFVDANKGYAYVDNKLYKTTNSGVNWGAVYTFEQNSLTTNRNALIAFNDIVYTVEHVGNLVTHKLATNLYSFFDNQSGSGAITFDGVEYSTPGIPFLRGGESSISSIDLNPNQINEKIFYKWSDGNSNYVNTDYYFNMSGTTISNYYKTKQISTKITALENLTQTKSLRDTSGAINQTHQSLEGGIFFSKSYNNGGTYIREEFIINPGESGESGNKNPSLFEAREYATTSHPVTIYNKNKNIVSCWEKFNQNSGKTEIKVAGRNYYYTNNNDTNFIWERWNYNNSDIFTSFNSNSSFNCYPKIFAISRDLNHLGSMNTYFLVIPHLRPSSNGFKIQISTRSILNKYYEFALDSGDISDLSVINSPTTLGNLVLHFTYRKNNQIIYIKASFEDYSTLPINMISIEGPTNISSGDGYASRYKPDISLMNGIPVVSYSANYNAYAMIDYENGGTDIIQISRYPVIKVERKGINDWGDYIIYNSVNVQGNPDIEGSVNTKSYLINYSAGNGLFKKVVNVFDHPGYFCDPNTFSGTDSRLIKNSYTGYFGNSLSLLTLSPNAGLYKLDKQNFNITNIVTADAYDNLGGVINLDTVRYSFNLGPLLVKEPDDEIIEISFDPKYTPPAPVMTPVEFNQNLRSNPFLLNESQALLVGCNVTYLKDDIDAVINEVRYSVDLMNKSTDSLHRVLYSDTIHADDSIATEYLRGYYITGIPNGEDSFYVKITVNNEDIAEGNFNINPGYDENTGAGDNSSGYRTKVIFENSVVENTTNIIPGEYSLEQNYPNPFNPATNLEFRNWDLFL